MSDATLRELVRSAEKAGAPEDLGKALRALRQAGRLDEACGLQTRLEGVDLALQDEVALGSVAELMPAPLGEPVAKLARALLWSPDGRALYGADESRALVAWDPATGERRDVAPIATCVRTLAIDEAGARMLLCVSDGRTERPKGVDDLQLVDLAAGKTGERLVLGLGLVDHVALWREDPDLLVVSGRGSGDRRNGHQIIGLRLKRGKLASTKPLWRETSTLIAPHAGGFVSVKRGKVRFHRFDAPADPECFPTECRNTDTDRLAAPSGRAVILGDRLWLIGPDGRELASSAPEHPLAYFMAGAWLELVPSPSGRHVAVTHKTDPQLTLVDVATGHRVEHRFDARVRRPAWSPSGRALAAPLDSNQVMLLRAP